MHIMFFPTAWTRNRSDKILCPMVVLFSWSLSGRLTNMNRHMHLSDGSWSFEKEHGIRQIRTSQVEESARTPGIFVGVQERW